MVLYLVSLDPRCGCYMRLDESGIMARTAWEVNSIGLLVTMLSGSRDLIFSY